MYPPQQPPPPGYPPQPPPYGYGYGYVPYMAPRPTGPPRSAIPRVIGVLAIVFSCFGLIGSAIWALGPLSDLDRLEHWAGVTGLGPITAWLWIWFGLSILIFLLHLIAGILAVQYKRSGLTLMAIYGIGAIVLGVADLVLVYLLIPERYHRNSQNVDDVWFTAGVMHIIFEVMALPWPIIAFFLARSAKARKACEPASETAEVFS